MFFILPFFMYTLARVLQLLGQAEIPSIRLFMFYILKQALRFHLQTFCYFHRHSESFGILLWNIELQISFIMPVRKVNFKYEENQMLLQHILRFDILVSGPWKHNAIEICIILIHHNALFVNNFLAHTVQMFQFHQFCL